VLNLVYGQYSGESDKKQDRENKGQGRDQSAKEGIPFLKFKCDRTVQENDRNAEYSGEQDNPYATDRRDPLHVIEMHNERTAYLLKRDHSPNETGKNKNGGHNKGTAY